MLIEIPRIDLLKNIFKDFKSFTINNNDNILEINVIDFNIDENEKFNITTRFTSPIFKICSLNLSFPLIIIKYDSNMKYILTLNPDNKYELSIEDN